MKRQKMSKEDIKKKQKEGARLRNGLDNSRDSIPRRQSDPLWLQDYDVLQHDKDTPSATATFVKYADRIYVVTCRHVADQAKEQSTPLPSLALHIEDKAVNLGLRSVSGIDLEMKSPHDADIAIALLDTNVWAELQTKKNKAAIDLDMWQEPAWDKFKFGMAAGYPNEHKKDVEIDGKGMVANGCINVVAEVASTLSTDSKYVTLSSELSKPHGYFFSGVSGGPIYGIDGEFGSTVSNSQLTPIGIVFEGHPSSSKTAVEKTEPGIFPDGDEYHIFVRGLVLTPTTFETWLNEAGYF